MDPFAVAFDLERGTLPNPARKQVRCASDMRGCYADAKALEQLIAQGNPVHYEVSEVPVPESEGHLMYCLSWLLPGKVGDEYFMTKGHFHEKPGTAEIYLCLRGEGRMLMKSPSGQNAIQKMTRGAMVYVPPFWAHRSINTGSEPLASFCVYPADAGHNYAGIAASGFGRRVFERGGRITVEDR